MTPGYTKTGLGLNERAGRLRNKRIGSLSDLMKLCYRKYRILCILHNRPFGEGKCQKYTYSELHFDRLVKDGRLGCPAERALVLWRIFLVVGQIHWSLSSYSRTDTLLHPVVQEIVCPFLGHVSLQLQLITQRLGCITSSLVNNCSKFILSCHNQFVLYSGWFSRNSPFQLDDRHLHVEIRPPKR